MPSNYNGDASGVTAHEQVTIACPVDGDARSAASVNTPLQTLADVIEYLQTNAALKGLIETAVFNGAAGDENASIECAGAISVRKLVWALTTPTNKIRFYQRAAGELEIVFNAKWRTATTDWFADTFTCGARPIDIAKTVIGGNGIKIYRPATTVGSNTWADADWELTHNLADDGGLKFITTTTGAAGSNPPVDTAAFNELRAKNIPKAFGRITKAAGANPIVIEDGWNVFGTPTATSDVITVTFKSSMANALFSVMATSGDPPEAGASVECPTAGRDSGHFKIRWTTVAGGATPCDLDSPAWSVDFVVFGQQDS